MEATSPLTSFVEHGAQLLTSNNVDNVVVKDDITSSTKETDAEASLTEAEKEEQKRFIPEHKKPDAALTFPEKMMNLMKFAQKQDEENFCVAWLPDGKSFVIRNPDAFTRQVLPKYFKATKFSSFTRKLYRWGFRQVNRGIGPDDPIIFGNEFFQRDEMELMTKMRSITAASTRKQEVCNVQILAQKRALESLDAEQNHKRVLLDQIMQQRVVMNQGMYHNNAGNATKNQGMFLPGGMNGMNLTSALRPNLVAGGNGFGGMMGNGGIKSFDNMFGQMPTSNPLMNAFQGGMNGLSTNQSSQSSGYQNGASTADIVNAAINALRFAP